MADIPIPSKKRTCWASHVADPYQHGESTIKPIANIFRMNAGKSERWIPLGPRNGMIEKTAKVKEPISTLR